MTESGLWVSSTDGALAVCGIHGDADGASTHTVNTHIAIIIAEAIASARDGSRARARVTTAKQLNIKRVPLIKYTYVQKDASPHSV